MQLDVCNVDQAIQKIIPYLDDTGSTAHKAIYFDGWDGLAASAVLRAIAEDPPPSLKKKFDKILHVDCSRWKSQRTLQRAIADELKLPQSVMTALDKQDEEDDFMGVEEGFRGAVIAVGRQIYQFLRDLSCLVILHNGSDNMIDLANCGIPSNEWFLPGEHKVLWTFRGRLRLNPEIEEKVDSSHIYIYTPIDWEFCLTTDQLMLDEATQIVKYIQHKKSVTPGIAAKCISYLLWLNKKGGGTMEYNWATHASNYWVCDGIIEGGQSDEAWDLSAALHQQIRLEECSSHTDVFHFSVLYPVHWKSVIYPFEIEERTHITMPPTLTSFFLTAENRLPLPYGMFGQSERLRVLKLSKCNFSFRSPPFRRCRSLRFLGLDNCEDQRQEEVHKQGSQVMGFFQSLWVLDVRNMDWELDLSQEIIVQMALNMREVYIRKGKFWRSNLSWRQLKNLRKLRVIEPISSWETGKGDEFMDMVKLELLDLSGNNTIEVLPSLCDATGLKTLILDACASLEYVGPEGLPPSLESFSFDAGTGEDGNIIAKVSRISLAGCAKLLDFRLLGSLPNLEELDLSRTAVKILDLKKMVQVQNLRRIFLIGCKQLRAIVWPKNGVQLRLLGIDTCQEVALFTRDSLVGQEQEKYCHARVCISDMRFFQSLVLTSGEEFDEEFDGRSIVKFQRLDLDFPMIKSPFNLTNCIDIDGPFKLNLYLSCTSKKEDGKNCNRSGQVVGSPSLHTSLISLTCQAYNEVSIEQITTEFSGSSALQFEPQDLHIEIGQGTMNTKALCTVMNRVQSLYLHDNSSRTPVMPEQAAFRRRSETTRCYNALKWCRVERFPALETVFVITDYADGYFFAELETFWAADLLMACSIWSSGTPYDDTDRKSFANMRAIHLHMCPRLQFVLPMFWGSTLSSLETLHIVCCSDLKQVFPVDANFLKRIATEHRNGMLEFPRLKHLHLHDLSGLQQICEAKMFAPELETVRLRGCWRLRRLPATDRHRRGGQLVDVDCEKDWWDNLEWDGLGVGHDPSLFAPRHSAYYKKRILRTTVLR
ncbi:unnamed protein product [Urochloa humidicola]